MKSVALAALMQVLLLSVDPHAASPSDSPAAQVHAPREVAYAAFSADPSRQFDGLLGEWDFVSAVPTSDGTLDEQAGAGRALAYSILGGKAELEIWDTSTTSGVTLRAYEPNSRRWVEWAFESNGNQVSRQTFQGSFRHGRATLYLKRSDAEAALPPIAYTVTDITPFSYRSDVSQSKDRRVSWETTEVREFTRTALEARMPIARRFAPPAVAPGRCDDPAFRAYELLIGKWRADGARFDVSPVLGGCGIMGLWQRDGRPDELVLLTYDVKERIWITAILSGGSGAGLEVYSGSSAWYDLVGESEASFEWMVDGKRGERSPRGLLGKGTQLHRFRGKEHLVLERLEDQEQ